MIIIVNLSSTKFIKTFSYIYMDASENNLLYSI